MALHTKTQASASEAPTEQAPPSTSFPAYPVSWYFFGTVAELRTGPVSRDMFGQRLVAFRTSRGRLAVLEARCSHLGADLGCGRVVGEALQCPFHHWEYGADGRCTHIPASPEIPEFACQRSFPVAERHGCVFVFNRSEALFPLPFYPGVAPEDLLCGKPYEAILTCPWYMVGANAFDSQHFRGSHDRKLLNEPVIDCPSAFARRATARFGVVGNSLQDRLTRLLAGDEVTLSITDYCGNLMLATATFRRTCTYGMVATLPLPDGRVSVRVLVMMRRSRTVLGRLLLDRLSLAIRRKFVNSFLSSDIVSLAGVRYNPSRLITEDRIMVEYFQWLATVSHGRT